MKTNEIYKAKVIEVLEDGSIIMSFQGSLVRMVNQSSRNYRLGEFVNVKVTKVKPLEFKLVYSDIVV